MKETKGVPNRKGNMEVPYPDRKWYKISPRDQYSPSRFKGK